MYRFVYTLKVRGDLPRWRDPIQVYEQIEKFV